MITEKQKASDEEVRHHDEMAGEVLLTEIDPDKEKKLVRKIDLHLIPILCLLLLSAANFSPNIGMFQDSTTILFINNGKPSINIGNARIQGLEKDLGMVGSDYNIALFTFFITYILFEVSSNMFLKRTRPSVILSFIVVGCGIVTVGQGVTHSFGGLVVCRVLIGFLEAGFVPGCVYLISMYYKRHELQWRINLFYAASILAGAFSGIATFLMGVFAYFVTPDWPQTAKFLTEEERAMVMARLAQDTPDASMNHWNKSTAKRVLGDLKIWLGALMYLGIVTTTYTTVITLTVAIFSDRLKHRFGFILLGCLITTTGYGILLATPYVPVEARYFALYLITCGCWLTQPVTVVWLNNNLGGHYKRGVGAAIQLSIGNCSGIVASNIFLPAQAPRYLLGYGLGLGFVWLCVLAACTFNIWIRRENKIRDAGGRDDRLDLPEEERNNLGDDHPSFRFTG
ncbi:unnamed protein product [Clonostachys chloroleuca]|uniref:Major facilitator superfamily (MFS) profile domain-containing protein n=1 Tax=Clonostachys chloroleuca TaxID=1926264 RepID=A0AA35MF23_9HYPO|nr:unnamed protein product [Clonostachys chloroleuca]